VELNAIVGTAERTGRAAPAGRVERLADGASATLRGMYPPAWKQRTDDADLDLVDVTLDRLDAAVSSGQWKLAEQARLEAYAFIEFGPELKLRSFDPGLAFDIEGFIWFGARGERGLAELIAHHAPRDEFRSSRLALDEALRNARATLGEGQSRATVVTNAAILVFREGLEAVLILAAITASMVGALTQRRRPVMVGAALGLVASILTWLLAQLVLDSLSRYGEKLEAVVGLIAIAVLLLVMNWFFHKVYWTEHIRKFHKRRKRLVGESDQGARVGFWSAQVFGFGLLGLTSVYREGFETVLFLQSLELATDAATVIEGAMLGLALTGAVAVVTFKLQRKLPYKRMLIATGVLLAFVLVVMVGTTARTLQGIGWLPITPIDVQIPYWAGTWLGAFPTWESLGAQVLALVIVFGSYVLAEELRVKRPRRRALRAQAAAEH
jgi:high-affinity iron transporter